MMKKYSLALICLFFIGFILGCNKEKRWSVEILTIDEITYNSADIEIDFDIKKTNDNTNYGVFHGTTPNPKLSNVTIVGYDIIGSEILTYDLENLYANTTYYVVAYLEGSEGNIYSEEMNFTTANTPNLDCSVSAGEIYYTGHETTESVPNLEEVEDIAYPDLFIYEVDADIGELTFTFTKKPGSGVYQTVDDETDLNFSELKPFVVHMDCRFMYGGSNCYYEAVQFEEITVNTDNAGKVSISFCELEVKKSAIGSCEDVQYLSGKVTE